MPNPLHSQRYQLFRKLLVQAREQSGLTQVQIAQILGKPQSFVSKYERGERRLDFTEFVELANVMNVDVRVFLEQYKATIENL